MPTTAEQFKDQLVSIVRTHYEGNHRPLLLARVGTELDKADAWPSDRGQRSLKQLIREYAYPDVDIVLDRRSPAYIAVVTPEVRETVAAEIEQRVGAKGVTVRLEDLVRPVLLAFCIDAHEQPVYVRRSYPFRYEVGSLPADQISDFVLVESEYRRPGLRVDRLQSLTANDRLDLANRIQRWGVVHEISIEQFYRSDQDSKQVPDAGTTALDRLLSAQSPDVAQRLMIPADIAQILAKLR